MQSTPWTWAWDIDLSNQVSSEVCSLWYQPNCRTKKQMWINTTLYDISILFSLVNLNPKIRSINSGLQTSCENAKQSISAIMFRLKSTTAEPNSKCGSIQWFFSHNHLNIKRTRTANNCIMIFSNCAVLKMTSGIGCAKTSDANGLDQGNVSVC